MSLTDRRRQSGGASSGWTAFRAWARPAGRLRRLLESPLPVLPHGADGDWRDHRGRARHDQRRHRGHAQEDHGEVDDRPKVGSAKPYCTPTTTSRSGSGSSGSRRHLPVTPGSYVDDRPNVWEDWLGGADAETLPPTQRTIIELIIARAMAGIAGLLGKTRGTIRQNLAHARKRLRANLGKDYQVDPATCPAPVLRKEDTPEHRRQRIPRPGRRPAGDGGEGFRRLPRAGRGNDQDPGHRRRHQGQDPLAIDRAASGQDGRPGSKAGPWVTAQGKSASSVIAVRCWRRWCR